jgi:sugar O-acyltransferase (sialic acid O-acetyltransferase NeuD family)
MSTRPLLLVGGGGHCRSCIEAIESGGRYRIIGIVDARLGRGELVLGYPVLGADEELPALVRRWKNAIVTVGSVGSGAVRARLFDMLEKAGASLPALFASTAVVSRRAVVGAGSIVMHGAVVNAGARVGKNCILNTGCLVEHDARVGDNCHVSTGAVVNGECTIGSDAFIGSGAVIRNGIGICAGAVIGAGAVVVKDIREAGTFCGVPARRLHA